MTRSEFLKLLRTLKKLLEVGKYGEAEKIVDDVIRENSRKA